MADTDSLRELAKAATPGPVEGCECYCHGTHPTSDICPHCTTTVAHTRFHRAASPDVVLALLDERDQYRDELIGRARLHAEAEDRLTAAEAALRALVDEAGTWEDGSPYWKYTAPDPEVLSQARAALAAEDGK